MNSKPAADIVVVGALDTKPEPIDRVTRRLTELGGLVHRIDFGVLEHTSTAETTPDQIAELSGSNLEAVRALGRAGALERMGDGVARRLQQLVAAGRVDAVMYLGGSGAGAVFAASAPVVPFGIPKAIVSTIVALDTRSYLQGLDATLFYPVTDVEGDNRILNSVLDRASVAVAAMAQNCGRADETPSDRITIGLTMFGITTPCVTATRHLLEERGYEAIAFHANGTGGQTFERLTREGEFDAVIDITTTELADEVAGGVLSAGSDRLTGAAARALPQVIVPGAIDAINFGSLDSVPSQYRRRRLHVHNPHVTLMRSDVEDNTRLGGLVARRANLAPSTTVIVLPMGGFSELSQPGMPFYDPVADEAFRAELLARLDPDVRVIETVLHINDPRFAALLVEALESCMDLS